MAKDPRLVDLKYEDKRQTIEEILYGEKLPVVVRVVDVGNDKETYNVFSSKLPQDTEIMLHHKLKVKYAHVQVLNHLDSAAKEKEMGPEFVLEHDTYVGVEFLLPVKYHGGIKFVQRPGSRRRYASVSQLMEQLPRYVKVLEETVIPPHDGIGPNKKIQKGVQLEIIRFIREPSNEKKYIEVSDGRQAYALGENDLVNLIEVDDQKVYRLYELVRFKMLPKVFQFLNDATKDVIILDNQLNSAAMAAVDGPLELIGFVDLEVVIGWIRHKPDKAYTTILIPSGLWKTAQVQQRSLHSDEEKEAFIKRKYEPCNNIDFVEKGLYLATIDTLDITWLRSPDFYTRSNSGNTMFETVKNNFGDSSDDEIEENDSIYQEIYEAPPAIPKRVPLMPLVKKKKRMFHKVHEELFELMRKAKHLKDHHVLAGRPPPRPVKTAKVLRSTSAMQSRPNILRARKLERTRSESTHTPSSSDDDTYEISEEMNQKSRDMLKNRPKAALPPDVKTDRGNSFNNVPPTNDKDNNAGTEAGEEESQGDYDYPDITQMLQRPLPSVPPHSESKHPVLIDIESPSKQPNYSRMERKDANHIFKANLTEKDFFKYSVMDTSHCFHHCGLAEFAAKCIENKLDGAFFQNMDLSNLTADPFCLSRFQVLKVEKIIYSGWRPNDNK